jgi:ligand-binding SRPBCC domain-containing protein
LLLLTARSHTLERHQLVGRPVPDVFAFFAEAGNLERITPPWLSFKVVTPGRIRMEQGALIEYRLRLHGVPVRWLTVIHQWEAGRWFADHQVRGPYRRWEHRHDFEPVDDGTLVRDRVVYELPFGPLGALAHAAFVRRDLEKIFDYRRDAVSRLLG